MSKSKRVRILRFEGHHGKKQRLSLAEAETEQERLQRIGQSVRVYHCRVCDFWHVGGQHLAEKTTEFGEKLAEALHGKKCR